MHWTAFPGLKFCKDHISADTQNYNLFIIIFSLSEDDTSLADYLESKVRVLCWIMTSPDNLEKKAIHVYRTWAHKCNKLIFVSSKENNTFPAPVISK